MLPFGPFPCHDEAEKIYRATTGIGPHHAAAADDMLTDIPNASSSEVLLTVSIVGHDLNAVAEPL